MTRVRGRCPSLYEPMESGDGLLARVKPPAARLSVAAAHALATASARYGSGVVELTSRGNLQVRGLAPDTLALFAAAMREAGLASSSPGFERVRNIAVSPLAGIDPTVVADTEAVAASLAHGLAETRYLHSLPGKFGFAVDGGGVLPLAAPWADVVLLADGDDWLVIPRGSRLGARVAATEAPAAALALARVVLDRGGGRMRDILGDDTRAVFAAAGLAALCQPATARDTSPEAGPGILLYPGTDRVALLAAPRQNLLLAADLAALADLAGRFGAGELRILPQGMLALPALLTDELPAALSALHGIGMVTDPNDPARRIVACPGAPACASGYTAARADAAHFAAAALPGPRARLHVSGCAKGCAHPQPAPYTLVGQADGYALVLDGRAEDPPAWRGLTTAAALDLIARRDRGRSAAPCP